MNSKAQSKLALVVVKLLMGGQPVYLMRRNKKWGDVNLIGGHQEERDGGNYERTAKRELREEFPPIRGYSSFRLRSLTPIVHYGPVHSISKSRQVRYELQYFLIEFLLDPKSIFQGFSSRTQNVWLTEIELIEEKEIAVSNLVGILNSSHLGGLPAIPLSSSVWLSEIDFISNRSAQPLQMRL